jgi:hypothetical protein
MERDLFIAAQTSISRSVNMSNFESRRRDSGRSHADRHPGLVENLDNPHPGNRQSLGVKSVYRSAAPKNPARRMAPQ